MVIVLPALELTPLDIFANRIHEKAISILEICLPWLSVPQPYLPVIIFKLSCDYHCLGPSSRACEIPFLSSVVDKETLIPTAVTCFFSRTRHMVF